MSRYANSIVFARSRRSGHSWRKATCLDLAVKDEAEELWVVVDPNEPQRALRILVDGVPGVQRVDEFARPAPAS